ncbi:MAG: hypothetical protein HPY66_0458 [Firmicutes bacterium]|nr:hypothetical protein [Bacillota bacterium]
MQLIDIILRGNHRSVSVIGTAKNAGKTVTLNYIIEKAHDRGISLGLTSTGRDGERLDLVTSTRKPPIYAHRGTVIATAQRLLEEEKVSAEIVEVTGMATSLGPVVIARVMSSGYVQLAGPDTNSEMKMIIDRLAEMGCGLILVDGALNRVSSASPSVTDGVIISTGAVVSRDMDKVIDITAHVADLFSLPQVQDGDVLARADEITDRREYALISREGRVDPLEVKTALRCGPYISRQIDEDTAYVVLGGSLPGSALKDIAGAVGDKSKVSLVVRDATRIFIEPMEWQMFIKMGVRVEVVDSINLLAVTVNPYAPQGYYFDPGVFLEKMRETLYPVKVFDVMQGGE